MNLKNMTIYSIFVRNHGGTFEAVRRDVARIRSLGVDTIWLLPIHPIGKVQRKGTLGSPYAISDYRAVNPEYGTLEDFKRLADEIHSQGMKLIPFAPASRMVLPEGRRLLRQPRGGLVRRHRPGL